MTDNTTATDAFDHIAAIIEGSDDSGDDTFARISRLIDNTDDDDGIAPSIMPAPPASSAIMPRSMGFDLDQMNREYALAIWGSKVVILNLRSEGPLRDRTRFLTLDALHSWFGNRFTEHVDRDGRIRVTTWSKAWQTHPQRRQYPGVEFFPNPDGAAGTPDHFNLWRGFDVQPRPSGTYKTFRDHLLNNVCAGDEALFKYVFGWIAHIVQKPRQRIGTAIVLRGKRGTGKSKVGEVIGSLFSAHYFQVDEARYVTGQFNAHMASCLLLQADEAVWAGDKAAEGKLKGLITAETQMVELKTVDAVRMQNYMRVLMTSNEGWVVPAGMDERRFCVLDVGSDSAQNHGYFAEMDDELAAGGRAKLLHDLMMFDLSQIDLWNAPRTRALLDQKIRSFDTIDDFWYNRLCEGTLLSTHDQWQYRVIAGDLHADYVKASAQLGIGRKRSAAEFGARLHKLVPGLRKARVTIETSPGVSQRLWAYEMPDLNECRTAFDDLLGQSVPWPALSPGEGERAKKPAFDDEVPM